MSWPPIATADALIIDDNVDDDGDANAVAVSIQKVFGDLQQRSGKDEQDRGMISLAFVSVNLYVTAIQTAKSVFSGVHYRCQHGRCGRPTGRPVNSVSLCVARADIHCH